MAVIITNMDMPTDCYECCLNNYHFCDITQTEIEKHYWDSTKPDDCPLKSTDEMIEEIEDYKIMQNPTGYILNVIHKYCDKENTDGSNNN